MSVSIAPGQHAVLDRISWDTYGRLVAELERSNLRLTYDGGALEVMSPSQSHERIKSRLRRRIEAAAEEMGVDVEPAGSTTWRREDLEKGIEPGECYWVQHEAVVRGRDDIDLRVDPPPDLAIEIDVHARSLDRLGIYAALGVPEVWRWQDGRITVHLLHANGSYMASEYSACFPWMPVGELAAWLGRDVGLPETQRLAQFRAWVRSLRSR